MPPVNGHLERSDGAGNFTQFWSRIMKGGSFELKLWPTLKLRDGIDEIMKHNFVSIR